MFQFKHQIDLSSFYRPDKTTEDMDEEGWMHSGDLGTMDSDGYLYITGN